MEHLALPLCMHQCAKTNQLVVAHVEAELRVVVVHKQGGVHQALPLQSDIPEKVVVAVVVAVVVVSVGVVEVA